MGEGAAVDKQDLDQRRLGWWLGSALAGFGEQGMHAEAVLRLVLGLTYTPHDMASRAVSWRRGLGAHALLPCTMRRFSGSCVAAGGLVRRVRGIHGAGVEMGQDCLRSAARDCSPGRWGDCIHTGSRGSPQCSTTTSGAPRLGCCSQQEACTMTMHMGRCMELSLHGAIG
jgi:hypothetical protein